MARSAPRRITQPDGSVVWQATFECATLGIRRTRRTFATKAEAAQWLKAARDDRTRARLGLTAPAVRRTFADALAAWMTDVGAHHARAGNTAVTNAQRLLWPYRDPESGRFVCLGDLFLDADPAAGERSIPAGLASWLLDLQAVRRRIASGRNHDMLYHLRAEAGELVW